MLLADKKGSERNVLEALRCRFCGGFINPSTYTCEYCGTVYMRPREPYTVSPRELVVVKEAPLITYGAQLAVDRWDFERIPKDELERLVRDNLVGDFEKAISENINIYSEYDIINMKYLYSAKLRVVKPNFKWGT